MLLPWLLLVALGAEIQGESGPVKSPVASEFWSVMGTFASLSVAGSDRENLPAHTAATKKIFQEIDDLCSTYKRESEISKLNRSAGKKPVPISKHTREVLREALKYARISSGGFDPTVVPLVRLWGFSGGAPPVRPPEKSAIRDALRRIGYDHLVLSGKNAQLELSDMGVDLGGIAKGYAVDLSYSRLIEMNAKNLMINLGGNIRCRGRPQNDRPWRIGVRNPFDRDQLVGTLSLTGGLAVATSGNYERFVTIGGKRFAHIIDPRTGRPVKDMAGVTVVSATAVEADALSTALFVLGLERSKPVLARLPTSQALFVPDRRPLEIWITTGLEKIFTPRADLAGVVKRVGE